MQRSVFACTAFLTLVFAITGPVISQELLPFIDGEVINIISGDSLTVKLGNGSKFTVRLQGIAAPDKRQPYAAESRQKLAERLMGKHVRVYFRFTDDLGRVIGKIIVGGEDVGLSQISEGYAWFYTKFANELSNDDRPIYDEEEAAAKKDKIGLWKDKAPVAPWKYRAVNKIEESTEPEAAITAQIRGNKRTKYYLRPECAGYKAIPAKYRVLFSSESEAEKAGFRPGANCK